jgi:hypothetical protein
VEPLGGSERSDQEEKMAEATTLPFDWADPFALDGQLSDE